MTAQVVTANRLSDGIVIFLGSSGTWSPSIDDAKIAECDEDAITLLSDGEASSDAVGVYLIEVDTKRTDAGERVVEPLSYRERIRAFGPSTHPSFAKKNVEGHFDPRHDVAIVFQSGI
jgi:hypothetical protein